MPRDRAATRVAAGVEAPPQSVTARVGERLDDLQPTFEDGDEHRQLSRHSLL